MTDRLPILITLLLSIVSLDFPPCMASAIYLCSRLGNIVHVHFIRQIHSISIIILHIRDITLSPPPLSVSISLLIRGDQIRDFSSVVHGSVRAERKKESARKKKGPSDNEKKAFQI